MTSLRSTLSRLLEVGAIPIINENDTVSTAELEPVDPQVQRRVNFGDNDKLSALVASKTESDLLMILTDVDGLYTADPTGSEDAELIRATTFTAPRADLRARVRELGAAGFTEVGITIRHGHPEMLEEWADLFAGV